MTHVARIGLDGVFPSRRTLEEADDPVRALEEERRLAYIAWTRARRSLRGETWTFLNRKAGHFAAVDFLDSLTNSPRVEVYLVPRDGEDEALKWLRRHDERTYSLVDATSFGAMRSLRIARAFAFDGDFAAAGFEELRPS